MSISKLVIKAYSNESFTTGKGEFSASINPANLKITSSVEYEKSQGMGSPNMALRYNVSPPKELSFKLIFDNTGIFPDSDKSVKDQLEALQDLVYKFQEDTNSPYYVRVIWGIIDFKGKLISLETSYTMFKSDGAPIRAEVDIVVLEDAAASKIAAAIKTAANANAAGSATALAATAAGSAAIGAGVGATATAAGVAATGNGSDLATDSTTNANATNAAATNTDEAAANSNVDGNEEVAQKSKDTPADASNKKDATNADSNPNNSTANPAAENASTSTPTSVKQVQDKETLPGVSKNALGNPNLAKSLGSINGLDSLRNLAPGLSLAVPLSAMGLLAMLLAMGKKYGSKGANYLKSKAKAGKDKAVAAKDKVKSKF
jgi:hypothetical protein